MKQSTKWKLAAKLLEMASDQFCNHGCNDFDLADVVPDITERKAIVAEYQDYADITDGWCSEDARFDIGDSELMLWLSEIFEEAEAEQPQPAKEDR